MESDFEDVRYVNNDLSLANGPCDIHTHTHLKQEQKNRAEEKTNKQTCRSTIINKAR